MCRNFQTVVASPSPDADCNDALSRYRPRTKKSERLPGELGARDSAIDWRDSPVATVLSAIEIE